MNLSRTFSFSRQITRKQNHFSTFTMSKIQNQFVHAPLTKSSTFLILTIKDWKSKETIKTIKQVLSSTSDLIKNVNVRDDLARFSCIVGIGSLAWDNLFLFKEKPTELHPFKEIKGEKHKAISTPGDLFYHIRSDRRDLCFEFERQLMDLLKDFVKVEDVTVGFRYFDGRDLLGFVDGTANPQGEEAKETVYVTEEQDSQSIAKGGSYIVVQKYLHSMKTWRTLPIHLQESILGRTKFDNIEIEDAKEDEQKSHKTLCTIEGKEGEEYDILRDNMPFGSPAQDTFGTYFIGYSNKLWIIEKMLENMFIGQPEGMYDRTLDFSTPITGSVFFAPSMDVLDSLDEIDQDENVDENINSK